MQDSGRFFLYPHPKKTMKLTSFLFQNFRWHAPGISPVQIYGHCYPGLLKLLLNKLNSRLVIFTDGIFALTDEPKMMQKRKIWMFPGGLGKTVSISNRLK